VPNSTIYAVLYMQQSGAV